ncbi:MAG: hypothetical protein A2Y25_08495 [Candidatus Melainabacteria bacterium GWF2_37_15]|nr:MAG: hypothetical protein A2Y25_08495 [Candidatus Melainabacteria bacterium GWF2_37_15]
MSDDDISWTEKKKWTDRAVKYYLTELNLPRSPAPLDVTMRRAAVMMKPYFTLFRNYYPLSNNFFYYAHWWHPVIYEAQMISGNDKEQDIAVEQTDSLTSVILQDRPLKMLLSREGMPRYSRFSPESANIFDNLHMLHGIGDVSTELFYTLNTESVYVPGMAITNRLFYPTNSASHGVDMDWRFLAVKKVGKDPYLQRVGVNLAWLHNFDRRVNERSDTYKIIPAYYRIIGPNSLVIIDYVRELNVEKNMDTANFIEIGYRKAVSPLTVLGLGLGVGLDNDSPRFRATISYQHSVIYPFYPFPWKDED